MKHTITAVKFDSSRNAPWQAALKERVFAELSRQPNGRFGNAWMAFKVVFFVGGWWSLWASLALWEWSLPLTALLIVVFSNLSVALAYNVSHDAVHGTLSRRRWLNELLFQATFNTLGPNAYLWRLRHRVMHHNCVNIPGFDFNIEASDILRFSPTQKWRPMHRYQHLYAPFLYLLFTAHWVFIKDFRMLFICKIGNVENIEHTPLRVLEVIAWKLFHVGLFLVLPVLATEHSFLQVLGAYLVFQAITSFQFVITFTGSHLNRGMVFVEHDDDNRVPLSFLEHQLRTSLDFHPRNPLVSFFLGGFNAHVAHHMFPQVCSVHYPRITRIIQETCAEFDMPYQQLNAVQLYASHFAYLKDLGAGADEPRAAYMHAS